MRAPIQVRPTGLATAPPRPIRVLWLVKGLGRGGAERLLVDAIPRLDRSRIQVELAYLLPWKDALVTEVEARGVRVHCLEAGHPLDARWLPRLRQLVRSGHFDIVHTHMPYAGIGARLSLPGQAPAIVHTEHNTWQRYRWPTRWANAASFGRNARVIAVSKAVAGSIHPSSLLPGQFPAVEVIVQGIDTTAVRAGVEARSRARRLLGLDDGDLVVGTVGNLTPKKDHKTLLSAAALLSGDHPRLRVVLVGTGPLEDALKNEAFLLGMWQNTVFAGSRGDVWDILPAFDVFALSSRHEGLPIALLEAMAAGLPSVATRVGGTPEALHDGEEGFLVPAGNPSALAAALGQLLADPGLRADMGNRAEASAARFDIGPAVRRTEEIYREVLGLA